MGSAKWGRGLSQTGWPGASPALSEGKTGEGASFHALLEPLALRQALSVRGLGKGEHPGRGTQGAGLLWQKQTLRPTWLGRRKGKDEGEIP